ncbi:MAG: acetyl-CoA carboxylase biotin carboxyl carrier protein [Bacteroidota bacterium]
MADSMIDIKYLQQLLEIFDASSVQDLRIEREGVEIRLSKNHRRDEPVQAMPTMAYAPMQMAAAPAGEQTAAQTAPAATAAPVAAEPEKKYHEIRSPIVGTFYRSPSPDSPVYAEIGSKVDPGSVLCIIEAMKLMNEIECDCYGTIAKILVENAQPVEYNQLLFLIEQN